MSDQDDKPRLTEEERKANHIASEQKRRQAIRDGFDRLSVIVPGMEGMARSEGVVLRHTIDLIHEQLKEREALIRELEAKGETVDPALKTGYQEGLAALEERATKAEQNSS
ncbi:hypothetical protein B0T24DRAFT_673697 [Lasiosphaeria ovina]|uniref:BHLH domain-containing protein n=1 Tax=Lasiosphaeria ovina TaxID=92902 RepID=A0AAE0TY79_9PEZI|nr:hypothetical protein B0T24DRAFT_673697 [Lasiosphaeria ovina]